MPIDSAVQAVRDAARALKGAVQSLIAEAKAEDVERLFDSVFPDGTLNQRAAELQIFNGTVALITTELRAVRTRPGRKP